MGSIGGVLLDEVGFDWAALFVVIMHVFVIFVVTLHYFCTRGRDTSNYNALYESLAEDVHLRRDSSCKSVSGGYGSVSKEDHLIAKVAVHEPSTKSGEYEAIS